MVDDFWALCAFKWRIVRLYIRFFFRSDSAQSFFPYVCVYLWVSSKCAHFVCRVHWTFAHHFNAILSSHPVNLKWYLIFFSCWSLSFSQAFHILEFRHFGQRKMTHEYKDREKTMETEQKRCRNIRMRNSFRLNACLFQHICYYFYWWFWILLDEKKYSLTHTHTHQKCQRLNKM